MTNRYATYNWMTYSNGIYIYDYIYIYDDIWEYYNGMYNQQDDIRLSQQGELNHIFMAIFRSGENDDRH